VSKNDGPVLSRLDAKVHVVLTQCRTPLL